jgi:hypothetical protein
MGLFADNPGLLEAAASYIRKGGVVNNPDLKVPEGGEVDMKSKIRDSRRARA